MTCIIGIAKDNKVVVGGDSAGVDSKFSLELREDPKVFEVAGRFVIGFTSSFRMGQLLMFGFVPPEQTSSQSDYQYMCTSFVDAVRKRLKEGGYTTVKDGSETGGVFIVAYNNKIYKIDSDFQVAIPKYEFTACGCGELIALGSMATLLEMGKCKGIEEVVRKALEITERFSAGVRSPFTIISK